MEENEMFNGFNNQSYTPDPSGVQQAGAPYMTDAPADDGGKKGKKEKKNKKGKKEEAAPATQPFDYGQNPYGQTPYAQSTEYAGSVAADNAGGKGDGDKKEKKELTEEEKEALKLKNKKTAVLTTYFVALLCLIAGLVAPLFNISDGDILKQIMLKYIPDMLNHMIGSTIINVDSMPFFEAMPSTVTPFTCVIGLLYSVITVVAIVMFVPILLCSIGKKNKKTGATAALIVEIVAFLITAAYVAYTTYSIVLNNSGAIWRDYNFFIPLGGVLLMAIFQVIAAKGSLGVSKTIAVLLSGLAVFALLDFATFIPQVGTFVNNFAGKFDINPGFISGLELATSNRGIDGFNILLHIFEHLEELMTGDVILLIVYILFMVATALVLLNLVLDVLELAGGKLTKKISATSNEPVIENGNVVYDKSGKPKMKRIKIDRKIEVPWNNPVSNALAIIRYVLVILLLGAILAIGMLFTENGYLYGIGVYFYLLLGVLVISLLNAAIRTAVANSKKKKAIKKDIEETEAGKKAYYTDGMVHSPDATPILGAQPYANPYGQQYYPDYSNQYGQPQQDYTNYANQQQQPAYDPYAGQQPAYDPYATQQTDPYASAQPAYDPYATQQQAVPEQTNYAQETPVAEQQSYDPYAPVQQTVDPYANAQQQPAYDPYATQQQNANPYYSDYNQNSYGQYGANDYVAPVQQEPVQQPVQQPVVQAAPVQQAPVQVENPFDVSLDNIPAEPVTGDHDGASDAFMATLSDEEKAEFLDVFVDKNKGSVKGIPDYVIGEDNSDFFSMVFVHINRYRNTVSDALMGKMYRQLTK